MSPKSVGLGNMDAGHAKARAKIMSPLEGAQLSPYSAQYPTSDGRG